MYTSGWPKTRDRCCHVRDMEVWVSGVTKPRDCQYCPNPAEVRRDTEVRSMNLGSAISRWVTLLRSTDIGFLSVGYLPVISLGYLPFSMSVGSVLRLMQLPEFIYYPPIDTRIQLFQYDRQQSVIVAPYMGVAIAAWYGNPGNRDITYSYVYSKVVPPMIYTYTIYLILDPASSPRSSQRRHVIYQLIYTV